MPLSLSDISIKINREVSGRTLRRWLAAWETGNKVKKTGAGPSTAYIYVAQPEDIEALVPARDSLGFLQGLDTDLRASLIKQIRDLWTHTSTALEGNTLSLGDTHFILEQGLTISGKPIKDHQEVRGHARAIELLYQSIGLAINKERLFALHRAVQTEYIDDIYKPIGAWKIESNGTHAVGLDNQQYFIEYALPLFVPNLMNEVLAYINAISSTEISLQNAPEIYAKIHMGIVHIHPFFDANGRVARLLANIPLLKNGLPPLVISQEKRQSYIQALCEYQISIGQLNSTSGAWPEPEKLVDFNNFCASSYASTRALVERAFAIQSKRPFNH